MILHTTKQFLPDRIQDQAKYGLLFASERDGNSKVGQTVGIICGAIQGVYDPFARSCPLCDAAFFSMLGDLPKALPAGQGALKDRVEQYRPQRRRDRVVG